MQPVEHVVGARIVIELLTLRNRVAGAPQTALHLGIHAVAAYSLFRVFIAVHVLLAIDFFLLELVAVFVLEFTHALLVIIWIGG